MDLEVAPMAVLEPAPGAPEITRTPLGAATTSERGGVTSSWRVGFESWATDEGSPAEAMMHLREAIRSADCCSAVVKDSCRDKASVWAA